MYSQTCSGLCPYSLMRYTPSFVGGVLVNGFGVSEPPPSARSVDTDGTKKYSPPREVTKYCGVIASALGFGVFTKPVTDRVSPDESVTSMVTSPLLGTVLFPFTLAVNDLMVAPPKIGSCPMQRQVCQRYAGAKVGH